MNDGPDHHPSRPPGPPDARADLRRARRRFLTEAALEAERNTGRREKTDEEARHSLWGRLARLIVGWILVLLGLAAIPLPGPGWLMVILGLTLLPYRWTDQLIRAIRKRIPGIPEDGRIPTRTWVVTGLLVALATGSSLWWGLRDEGNDSNEDASAATTTTAIAAEPADAAEATVSRGPDRIVMAASRDVTGGHLTTLYGYVAATATDRTVGYLSSADPCAEARSGRADLVVLTAAQVTSCFGGATEAESRDAAIAAGLKMFAPFVAAGVTYVPAIRTDTVAIDDEPAELAVDGVSQQISAGADTSGDPAGRAHTLMRAAGVLK